MPGSGFALTDKDSNLTVCLIFCGLHSFLSIEHVRKNPQVGLISTAD